MTGCGNHQCVNVRVMGKLLNVVYSTLGSGRTK